MNNKIIGIIGVVFGLLAFSPFFIGDRSKLIVPVSDILLVKYFIVVLFVNGGLFFLLGGILAFLGLSIPRTKYEKARNSLIAMAFLSPFLLSFLTTIFTQAKALFWKIAGWATLLYLLLFVYDNVRTLQKGADK